MEAARRVPVTYVPKGGGGGLSCCGARWPGWRRPPWAAPPPTVSGGLSREGRSVWVRAGRGGQSRGPPRLRTYKQAFAFSLLSAPGTPLPACFRLRQGFPGLACRRIPASKTRGYEDRQGSAFFHAGELTSFKGPHYVLKLCSMCLGVFVLKLLLGAVFLRHIKKSWFPCVSSQNVGGNSVTGSSRQFVKTLAA